MRTRYGDNEIKSISDQESVDMMKNMSDREIEAALSFPMYQTASGTGRRPIKDEDGFVTIDYSDLNNFVDWQAECWKKADGNPQINSHIRDFVGRVAGWGFEINSQLRDVQAVIDDLFEDPRNDLYQKIPQYVARSEIEGELHLLLSIHKDTGFIEVDFISPQGIRGGGQNNSGVIFHPSKQTFPLYYFVQFEVPDESGLGTKIEETIVPSINIAYFPELDNVISEGQYGFSKEKLKASKDSRNGLEDVNNYYRFMIKWDRSFLTQRNVSHIKTTIEWVNYYEDLKRYEIDHKKSSGSYLWVVKMEDRRAFREWLNLSPEERKNTGIMEQKEPGGTMVLPPGLSLEVHNPNLNSISDQDTDVMQMVSSGLNKPQDMVLGDYSSTYASVKAAQGPQSDRVNDELAYFKRFLIYEFFRGLFYLKSVVDPSFAWKRKVEEAVDFSNGQPRIEKVKKPVYKLIDIVFPVSNLEDTKNTADALLGANHGSVADVLGIPKSEIAKRLGFTNYPTLRKIHAAEEDFYPTTESNPGFNPSGSSSEPQKSTRTK